MKRFYIANEEEIKRGDTTDIYFIRTLKILKNEGLDKTNVVMEISPGELPYRFTWGILSGVHEVVNLLEGLEIDLFIIEEGTIFKPFDSNGVRTPIGFIHGPYGEFTIYETPLLGILCQYSGVATYAAHIRFNAWDKTLLSFGARRMHPAVTPLIDYAAYIGGFDGVSSIISAEIIGLKPMGTMPHALIIIYGDQVSAWLSFDRHMEEDVPRIALIDTFYDEKIEAIKAAEVLGNRLYGVRLDTPGSRRGDIKKIINEVRWELDIRGYDKVKIFLSGGVNLDLIKELADTPVDGYGIGSSISNSRIIDFALDIVEKEGRPLAKRGKFGGTKLLFRCPKCYRYESIRWSMDKDIPKKRCRKCDIEMENLMKKVVSKGEIIWERKTPKETRAYVLEQLEKIRELGWND